jgi:beta-galactosidase
VTNPSVPPPSQPGPAPSRRAVLRGGALGGAALMSWRALRPPRSTAGGGSVPARAELTAQDAPLQVAARTFDFNQGWLFGGVYVSGAEKTSYADSAFTHVTVPHTVVPLSWGNWDHTTWEKVFIYRKHFSGSGLLGGRVFADFDGAAGNATVYLNGVSVTTHQGGYLPFSAELTSYLVTGDNVLAVVVDARQLDVPPDNPPGGAAAVDYLQPGGIYRDVRLRYVPPVFIADVFAQQVNVLTPASRELQIQVTLNATAAVSGAYTLTAQLLDGSAQVASATGSATITAAGQSVATLTMTGLQNVSLWSPAAPKLYTLRTTMSHASPGQTHVYDVTTGFRQAEFQLDGFYLNGERLEIFGLNRHQHFPYLGMAACARLQRRDAEILKNDLNCNMVRCSHYPQSPDFLDACDELGLMVWEETPGWQYVGDAAYQAVVVQNVHDMVVRDRNRPSVIVWGTRLNETANYVSLYQQTRQEAATLDPTRPSTGAMSTYSLTNWAEDLYSYDDYHVTSDGAATLEPPMPGVPYMVSESVGALDGAPTYRWVDTEAVLAEQGLMHAQVHNIAQGNTSYAGLLGWCGFDYASLNSGDRIWQNLKTPGVMDMFRVPKPGAAFYRSQVDPAAKPVILPLFFWDYGTGSPDNGPGPNSLIATNCDRLELYVNGTHLTTAMPDTTDYPNLAYPMAVADLSVNGAALPELRIDGYVGTSKVASVMMSSNPVRDQLSLTVDDTSIQADGTDATRVTFRALDAYGNQRPYVSGTVTLAVSGPATLVGDSPFAFGTYGGVGGAFVRSTVGGTGTVAVTATHAALGSAKVSLTVTAATGFYL